MKIHIGLDAEARTEVGQILNLLFADETVLWMLRAQLEPESQKAS